MRQVRHSRLDHLIPSTLLADARLEWRARFLLHAAVFGSAISMAVVVVCVLMGWWVGVVSMLLCSLVLPAVVGGLRVSGSLALPSHLGLSLVLVSFLVPALVERDADGALLAYFALFPYFAMMLLDLRAARIWLGIVVLALAGIMSCHLFSLVPTLAVPDPHLLVMVRVGILVVVVSFLGVRFLAERERATAEVERTAHARASFLARMSHELRTPMHGVLGLTEEVLREPLPESQRARLELVHRSGQALVARINDQLDFSKIEAGKLRIEPTDVHLDALLSELTELHLPLAAQKHVTLTTARLEEVPPVVRGDPLRLRQVLNNLLSNALKFTQEGSVQVLVKRVPAAGSELLAFEVRDTGIGIAPEVLPHLFKPLERIDDVTARRFGGAGLGLALCRDLAELMGGRLEVQTAPGHGAQFTFVLDLVPGVEAHASTPVIAHYPVPVPARLAPVLVVDDNAINLMVAAALVKRAGFPVLTAVNGQEALQLVERVELTAVLMDCHMPVMDGLEATERIRKLPDARGLVPVIAVTASAMPDEVDACRRSGMNDCLTKPLAFETLQKVLASLEPKYLLS